MTPSKERLAFYWKLEQAVIAACPPPPPLWPPPPMRDPRPEDGGFDTPQPIREHTHGWMPGDARNRRLQIPRRKDAWS